MSLASWCGFPSEEFFVDNRNCVLVKPKKPEPASPWIWRMEFFGAFPAVDLDLLERGYHLVYMDLQDLYGAPPALRHMNRLFTHVTRHFGLKSKCVLEGFSRGALFALNWGRLNAEGVACIYLDAPVCDFKSWPAGKGRAAGSPDDWQKLKAAYGLSESEALSYPGNPVDSLVDLAASRVPIIAVYGEADVDLPPEENILLLESRYRALGGEIVLIPKPGVGHHPHSLDDPSAIVEFICSKNSH
jgi:pimeloyl-ACP methyl ester carboxylesterase